MNAGRYVSKVIDINSRTSVRVPRRNVANDEAGRDVERIRVKLSRLRPLNPRAVAVIEELIDQRLADFARSASMDND